MFAMIYKKGNYCKNVNFILFKVGIFLIQSIRVTSHSVNNDLPEKNRFRITSKKKKFGGISSNIQKDDKSSKSVRVESAALPHPLGLDRANCSSSIIPFYLLIMIYSNICLTNSIPVTVEIYFMGFLS